MRAAIINEHGVVETVVDVDEVSTYLPGPNLIAVDATDEIAYGGCTWTEEGGFVEPPRPAPSKADLLSYAADKRWQVETGGLVIGGVPVATDDRSKIMIIGARVKALFGRDQFVAMAECLSQLKGRFILSVNDVPEIRDTFSGFQMEEARLRYTVSGGRGMAARELIITRPDG